MTFGGSVKMFLFVGNYLFFNFRMFVGSSLRYNIFPKSTREKFMMTINCVRVDTPDLKVEDGVVHVMESMIPPTTMNIKDTLIQSPHFKSFRKRM